MPLAWDDVCERHVTGATQRVSEAGFITPLVRTVEGQTSWAITRDFFPITAGVYTDWILKGDKLSDLLVQQATKVQLGKFIVDIATGEVEDRPPMPEEQGKDPAAASPSRRPGPGERGRRDDLAGGRLRFVFFT
jgi:hypothetical protein